MWRAFKDLPAWQKGAIGVTGVMLAPMGVFLLTITGLSLFPLLLLGRFEGSLGKRPLQREVERVVRRERAKTEDYYASTPGTPGTPATDV